MRQNFLRTTAALALILPALVTNAMAQEKKDQRGAAPAAHAAPAAAVQHAAPPAPAPHVAAPVAAAPHVVAAPAQHFTAPAAHIAAPVQQQQQQHIAAPVHVAAPVHAATPHIATQQNSRQTIVHQNGPHPTAVTSTVKQQQIKAHGNDAGPHNLAHRGSPTTPNAANSDKATTSNKTTTNNKTIANDTAHTVTGPNKTLPNSAASKLASPNKTGPNTTSPSTATPRLAVSGAPRHC